MILKTNKKLTKSLIREINSVANSIAMTISSQAPRTVPTNIVGNNLVKVQRLGSEIGINNLPTSARQLKHKVIKCCESCNLLELTSKYNYRASVEKNDKVLCKVCAQNTPAENARRSETQRQHMADPEYKANALKKLFEESRSPRNSERVIKAHADGKYANKDWSYAYTDEWRIKRHCIASGISIEEFTGFVEKQYPPEFNWARKKVLKKDDYSCKLCGTDKDDAERPLHVHHIDGIRSNNGLENLATVCEPCHVKIHKVEGYEGFLNSQLKLMI